ncbi:hypothetical protein HK101_005718, partial [Irineochytrium annulatum]
MASLPASATLHLPSRHLPATASANPATPLPSMAQASGTSTLHPLSPSRSIRRHSSSSSSPNLHQSSTTPAGAAHLDLSNPHRPLREDDYVKERLRNMQSHGGGVGPPAMMMPPSQHHQLLQPQAPHIDHTIINFPTLATSPLHPPLGTSPLIPQQPASSSRGRSAAAAIQDSGYAPYLWTVAALLLATIFVLLPIGGFVLLAIAQLWKLLRGSDSIVMDVLSAAPEVRNFNSSAVPEKLAAASPSTSAASTQPSLPRRGLVNYYLDPNTPRAAAPLVGGGMRMPVPVSLAADALSNSLTSSPASGNLTEQKDLIEQLSAGLIPVPHVPARQLTRSPTFVPSPPRLHLPSQSQQQQQQQFNRTERSLSYHDHLPPVTTPHPGSPSVYDAAPVSAPLTADVAMARGCGGMELPQADHEEAGMMMMSDRAPLLPAPAIPVHPLVAPVMARSGVEGGSFGASGG